MLAKEDHTNIHAALKPDEIRVSDDSPLMERGKNTETFHTASM